jgi:hypothetical protein
MAKGREFRKFGVRGGALAPRLGDGPSRPVGGRLGRPALFPSVGVPDSAGASEALPGPFGRGFSPAGCQHSRPPLLSTVLTDSHSPSGWLSLSLGALPWLSLCPAVAGLLRR